MDLHVLYDTNADFKRYCDKSLANGTAETLDDLLQHAIVKNVAQYYLEPDREKRHVY